MTLSPMSWVVDSMALESVSLMGKIFVALVVVVFEVVIAWTVVVFVLVMLSVEIVVIVWRPIALLENK